MSTTAPEPTPSLLPQHQKLIDGSAISREVAEARGYRTVTRKVDLKSLGFSGAQCRVPALLIPVWTVHGEIGNYQLRPDAPRIVKGKPLKYETPKGSRMLVDVPPSVRDQLRNPAIPLWITEGARKADSAVSSGLCCIAILGVWNWRGTNEHGGKTALPDWESIALNGRAVFLAFDNDAMTKPQVHGALGRLLEFIKSRGAQAKIVYLPDEPSATKVGLDDYLADGHSVEELQALASPTLRPLPREPDGAAAPRVVGRYQEALDGISLIRKTELGDVHVPLTNFRARIIGEVVRDDGAETETHFRIRAAVRGTISELTVPSSTFGAMTWPLEHLGARAIVHAGMGNREHARAAIQELSGTPQRRTVYLHTGWREVGGVRVFLHGGGSIGPRVPNGSVGSFGGAPAEAPTHTRIQEIEPQTGDSGPCGSNGSNGSVSTVEVELPPALAPLILPAPPESREQASLAVRASLRILDLIEDPISVPLLGLAYRAPLGDCDVSGILVGATGAGKTELCCLGSQHYGAGFSRTHLPSWGSTGNFIEGLAFLAKDVILPVDDFAPQGTAHDVARQHAQADRVFRGAGNRSGRGRMAADGSLRPTKSARGVVLATGEDTPRGQSVRARMVVMEVRGGLGKPGGIDAERLTRCQEDAAQGLLAQAMAGYIQHLAGFGGGLEAEVKRVFQELRAKARGWGAHARDPEKAALLGTGWHFFLDWAVQSAALSIAEAAALRIRVWTALERMSATQAEVQRESNPIDRFPTLLASAISSGIAHVSGPDGGAPVEPVSWGWEERVLGAGASTRTEWLGKGRQVGWIDEENLYLDAEAALQAAQAATGPGEGIALSRRAISKQLHEAGLLLSVAQKGGETRYLVARTLQGKRRSVLHVSAGWVLPTENRPIRPIRPTPHSSTSSGPEIEDSGWVGPKDEPTHCDLGPTQLSVEPTRAPEPGRDDDDRGHHAALVGWASEDRYDSAVGDNAVSRGEHAADAGRRRKHAEPLRLSLDSQPACERGAGAQGDES